MNFLQAIGVCFKKYASFKGRARRKEYWYWVLFHSLVYGAPSQYLSYRIQYLSNKGLSSMSDADLQQFEDYTIYSKILLFIGLGILLPTLAVAVRRLHDAGKSGWFIFVPIYNLILFFMNSQKGKNKWGDNPKDA